MRTPKIKGDDLVVLKESYFEQRMSTTEISDKSLDLFGFNMTPATVFNSLRRNGFNLRTKSGAEGRAKHKSIPLSSIIKTKQEKWDARWLISSGRIVCEKSVLSPFEAARLRSMLDSGISLPSGLIDAEFLRIRKQGFPYYRLSLAQQQEKWKALASFRPSRSGVYDWSGAGTDLASFWHPHMFECRRNNKMTALDFFGSDVDLRRGIDKIIRLYGKSSDAKIREICRNENASSRINNFPPRVASIVIRHLFDKPIDVLDPTAGFSGRLLGCAASGLVKEYVGIDLSPQTAEGLKKTADFLAEAAPDFKASIIQGDCLQVMPQREFDLIFTSPPFLNVEQYKDVPFQSDYDAWMRTFIEPLLTECFVRLKSGGMLALYLEKIGSRDFQGDVDRMAQQIGFVPQKPILFKISYGENNRDVQAKREIGIQVWRKS